MWGGLRWKQGGGKEWGASTKQSGPYNRKYNIEKAVDQQIEEMSCKIEVLDQRDVEGKPIESGWNILCGAFSISILSGSFDRILSESSKTISSFDFPEPPDDTRGCTSNIVVIK